MELLLILIRGAMWVQGVHDVPFKSSVAQMLMPFVVAARGLLDMEGGTALGTQTVTCPRDSHNILSTMYRTTCYIHTDSNDNGDAYDLPGM